MSEDYRPIPYRPERVPTHELRERAAALEATMAHRRSVRMFSTDPVPREVIASALRIAGSAPSGAHRQPWTWVVIEDPERKAALRAAAEEEERRSYEERMPDEWKRALAPLGTDWVKTHLTDAPYVLVLFARGYDVLPSGEHRKNYYVTESCAIAAGFLISALHQIGLATLPHTPSPMRFLNDLLERPDHERPLLVLPVGHPADDAVVPDLERKPLDAFVLWR